jgi:hypothetical protein
MLQLRKADGRWQVIARSMVQEATPTAGGSGGGG